MSACDTIARWMCNEPGVFTSREAAERCSRNTSYRYVYALSYVVIALFFAVLFMYISGYMKSTGDRPAWFIMIPFIAFGIVAYAGKWGYDRSLTVPLEEQEKDELEIKGFESSGMSRVKAIETVKRIRGAECRAERARDRYDRRGSIGIGGINFRI